MGGAHNACETRSGLNGVAKGSDAFGAASCKHPHTASCSLTHGTVQPLLSV